MRFNNSNAKSSSPCARGTKSCQDCGVWKQLIDPKLTPSDQAKLESMAHSCEGCQQSLESMDSSDLPWWNDARSSWLESDLPLTVRGDSMFVSIEVQSDPLPLDNIDVQRVSIDFLAPASHPELLGRIGRYDVERVMCVGGMGVVLKTYDSELHRVVAVKVLAEHLASNSSARKRFAREAQAASAVVHPNVIPIYNVESDGKHPFLVMQYVNGGSLQSKVDLHGPLTVAETLRVVKQTAAGLAAAHQQGLVHRDVKPANILLEENVDRVLLSDFGLARAVDDASFTRTGVIVGTPHYMSPEQANGETIQHASDQFSLGSVTYFMLTGHSPFRAPTAMGVLNRICHSPHRPIAQVNSNVPVEVAELIDRMLDKNPSRRFESMLGVEKEADRLLSALQSGNLRISRKPFFTSGLKTKSTALIASLLMAVFSLSGWAIWQGYRIEELSPDQEVGSPESAQVTSKDSPNVASDHRSSISVRELESALNQWQKYNQEDNGFSSQIESAQVEAQSLEQAFQGLAPVPTYDATFEAEVIRLRSQIDAVQSNWSAP